MAENLLDNKILASTRPKAVRNALVDQQVQKMLGYQITQNKSWADFVSPFSAIAVGFATISFVPSTFQYPDSEHFLVTSLRIYQGANATLNVTAWTPGVAAGDAQNGTFTINNNGTNVMKDVPFTAFSQGTNNADGGYLELACPFVWVGQTSLSIIGTWPAVLTTTTLNLRFELVGLKLI